MLSSKDMNFMGYTYKNFEIVNDHEVPGMVELKKNNKPKRPTVKSLFSEESDSESTQSSNGSFLNLLPPKSDTSKECDF
ncbi:non-specific serine/threonine protein kinase [Salvia divinorum]|uniref:Non-specific serine/threonine protein kinase n=2 Tax=Salvia divinorum TaxID=28513 RepID=A0ABD1FWB7_SALDI